MVVSNWAILAILTSVVSDNMISASRREEAKDEKDTKDKAYQERVERLETLFHEIDTDGNGFITLEEWVSMLEDDVLKRELLDATGLGDDALQDYFRILSSSPEEHKREEQHKRQIAAMDRKLNYN